MNYSDTVLAARYTLGLLTVEDVVKFADQKLTDGFYSDHYLNIIDEDLKFFDVLFPFFKLALIDLKIIFPNFKEATLILIEHHIMEILKGKVDPFTQFNILVNELNDNVYRKGLGVDDIYRAFVDVVIDNEPINGTEVMSLNRDERTNCRIIRQCEIWAKINGKKY